MELDDIRDQLVPLLHSLDRQLENEQVDGARPFFEAIRRDIEAAGCTTDLMNPFQVLSTAAFRGFLFGPESLITVDAVLERAHGIAMLLASSDEVRH